MPTTREKVLEAIDKARFQLAELKAQVEAKSAELAAFEHVDRWFRLEESEQKEKSKAG